MHSSDPTSHAVRSRIAKDQGVTAKRLRGPGWVKPLRGVVRPADIDIDPVLQRIGDVRALLGPRNALGGWASLRFQGNTWFDGLDRAGGDRDVSVHCLPGSQLRVRAGVRPTEGLVHPDELIDLEGCAVTTMARAAYDEMRVAANLREAVVVHDMATSTTSGVAHTTSDRIRRVIASHRKTRGIVQASRALDLGSSRSASPWETRTRMIAELDAGITGLRVNCPVFDLGGNLLGVADLLDESSGLVIESDGGHHRENEQHTADNRREEKFERARMVVCRVTSLDHGDRFATAARMVAARRDALRESSRRWTTQLPDWWASWSPARRWD